MPGLQHYFYLIIQHCVGKLDQFFGRSVNLTQQPAFHDTGQSHYIKMGQRFYIHKGIQMAAHTDFISKLFDGKMDNGIDI